MRYSIETTASDYRYTGQLEQAQIGLDSYIARWYDPSTGHFIQANTVIVDPTKAKTWDRYAYVKNNLVDPSGHLDCSKEDLSCVLPETNGWQSYIQGNFGVTMSDSGDNKWDSKNLKLMYDSLSINNKKLNGKLKDFSSGKVFDWGLHTGNGDYNSTTHQGEENRGSITFYIKSQNPLRQQNIFHEIGHLLDSYSDTMNGHFTQAVKDETNKTWIDTDNKINLTALKSNEVSDPNYPDKVQARQTYFNFGPTEQWADAFANYVADNINMETDEGAAMYNFVTGALSPYIN